jgi:membrane fusion protein
LQVLDNELILQRKRVALIRDVVARITTLEKSGTVSKLAMTEKAADALEQESRLSAIELQRLNLQREIAALQAARLDLPHQAEREVSLLKRNMEELKQQISESEVRRQVVIRADQAGQIAGVVVNKGQAVSVDQRIASLLPLGSRLEAELYAPTRAAGFIGVGTQVLLRYEAYPYQKFGQFRGSVREISLNTIPLGELQNLGASFVNQINNSGGNASEPVYRIRVQLDTQEIQAFGRAHRLKPGMQLAASLVLEHRTLAEWALAPLYGMAGQLGGQP